MCRTNTPSNLTRGTAAGTAHAIIFGDWTQLRMGKMVRHRPDRELLLARHRASGPGDHALGCGVAVRHGESFAAIVDGTTDGLQSLERLTPSGSAGRSGTAKGAKTVNTHVENQVRRLRNHFRAVTCGDRLRLGRGDFSALFGRGRETRRSRLTLEKRRLRKGRTRSVRGWTGRNSPRRHKLPAVACGATGSSSDPSPYHSRPGT